MQLKGTVHVFKVTLHLKEIAFAVHNGTFKIFVQQRMHKKSISSCVFLHQKKGEIKINTFQGKNDDIFHTIDKIKL